MKSLRLPIQAVLAAVTITAFLGAQTQPNVLVILADDMGYGDLSCYGSNQIATPNLDALALSGTRCTNGYVSAGVCAPSRAGSPAAGPAPAALRSIETSARRAVPSGLSASALPETAARPPAAFAPSRHRAFARHRAPVGRRRPSRRWSWTQWWRVGAPGLGGPPRRAGPRSHWSEK